MAKLHNPATMQWELTTECNHDCVHCYNYWRKDFEKIADLSRSKTEQEYLEIAKRIVKIKPVAVTLTGGEPLLVFNEIKSSLEYLQKNNIFVTINTNATLLTDEMCKYLKNRRVHLFVSFPCAEPEVCDIITNRSGSFSRITKSLDLAYSFGVDFVCNVVVSKQNIDYVEKTVDFLVENYRLDYISLTRVAKPINSDDSFNSWLLNHDDINRLLDISVKKTKEYKGLTIGTACPYTPCSINSQDAFDLFGYQKLCTAGKTSFAIDIDGNFKACPRDSRHYGNILLLFCLCVPTMSQILADCCLQNPAAELGSVDGKSHGFLFDFFLQDISPSLSAIMHGMYFLLRLFPWRGHFNDQNSSTYLYKLFGLLKPIFVFFQKIIRQPGEIFLAKADDQEVSGKNVIHVSAFIP